MMKILTAAQIRQIEEKADQSGISYLRLMENAGTACARAIRKRFDGTEKRRVVVLCGKGKNGGDGFVVARKLNENGYRVQVISVFGAPAADNAAEMFSRLADTGVHVSSYNEYDAAQKRSIESADILVDAVFGTGFSGVVNEKVSALFNLISNSEAYVVSIDLPSGMEADSSCVTGAVVKADLTVAVMALKNALVYYPSAQYAGEITVVSIGIPEEFYNTYDGAYTLSANDIRQKFHARAADSNKGDFGKGLIIAGSYEMPGAAVLASGAAVVCGAGLVKLAFPDKAYPAVTAQYPEKVLAPLASNRFGRISAQSVQRITEELKQCDAVLLGCGLGMDYDTCAVVEAVLQNAECPVILDADGINAVADNIHIIKNSKAAVILTPHPGEAARLLSTTVEEIQRDRRKACREIFEKTGAVVVLKGARTVVTANGMDFYVNVTGNAGMATAGMGDLLAGMILSLICQRIKPFSAAVSAVFIHGMAGDVVKRENSEMGVTPSKMLEALPKALKIFEN